MAGIRPKSFSAPRLRLVDCAGPSVVDPTPLYWKVDGHRLAVLLYPPASERPAPDAQLHPSGIWVSLRLTP